jgi:hypothetical protein
VLDDDERESLTDRENEKSGLIASPSVACQINPTAAGNAMVKPT